MLAPVAMPVQTTWLSLDGLRIRCLRAGDRGSAVVLLHGGAVDAAGFSFRHAVPVLADLHRVYAPDFPGFGESDPLPTDWSVANLVPLVGSLLDVLQLDHAAVVGLSLGGGAALGFALQAPARVEHLVLVDSYGLGGDVPGGAPGYLAVHLPLVNWASWWLLARSRRLARWSLRSTFPCHPEMATDYLEWLHELAVPTLLVHGAHDPAVPVAWAERAARLIRGSRLAVIPSSGHVTPLERPEDFNAALLQFLEATGSA